MCAFVEPSQSCTSAWMIDCGCTTTSMRSYGVPNRWWASITSRPLFISVAESIVILPPIVHVGCLSASSTVTSCEVALAAAERAAGGGDDQLLDHAGRLAGEQVVHRGVLGVDRDQLGAGGLGQRGHELAADDERLLVGQRDVDALGERDDRRAEAGGADDRVEHEVGAGLGDELDEPLGAGEHLAAGPGLGGARGGVASVSAIRVTPCSRACSTSGSCCVPADRPTSSNASGARSTTSSAWVPIEPGRAEDEEPLHGGPLWQRPDLGWIRFADGTA